MRMTENDLLPSLRRSTLKRRAMLAGSVGLLAAPRAVLAQTALSPAPGAPAAPPAAPSAAPAAGANGAQSAVIDVNHARAAPIPIAIPNLPGGDNNLGAQITEVVTNDLKNCGLFRPIDQGAFIAGGDSNGMPNFQNWKAIGAQALVTGQVTGGGGNVRVEFRLWDVLPGTQLQGTAFTTTTANWRRIAHIMADAIYERLIGEKGYFDTRIVYVSNTGPRDRRTRRLAIMDQDSANNRYLTNGSWMALTPRFSPVRDQIVFMSYANNRPRVYLFDLENGQQRVLGDFNTMTLAPRFSPDGNSVIMSVSRGGGSDIVVVGVNGGGARQLTSSGAIDVSPCYSPDGSQIVFNSDRDGNQQLYVMDAGGGGVRRISFGAGAQYATPVWSPRGDLIAFTRMGASQEAPFSIGVMAPDGTGERLLSEAYMAEAPTFCPNGRVLAFWREGQGGGPNIVSIDITGFNERPMPTPTQASDPAWSPLNA
jgi:TolB protein